MLPVLKLCIVLFLFLKGESSVELSYITEHEKINLTLTVDENFKPTALTAFSNGKECNVQFARDSQYYGITISNCEADKISIFLLDIILKKGVYSMLSVPERQTCISKLNLFIHKFLRCKRQSLPEESPVVNKTQQIIAGKNGSTTVVETTAMFDVQFSNLDELTYFCDMDNDVLMAQNPDVQMYKSASAYNSAANKYCPATLSQNREVVSVFNCSLTTEVHLFFTSIPLADVIIGGKQYKLYSINCLESQSNFTSDTLHNQSNLSMENVRAMFRGVATKNGRFLEHDSHSDVSATGFKFKWSSTVLVITQTTLMILKTVCY